MADSLSEVIGGGSTGQQSTNPESISSAAGVDLGSAAGSGVNQPEAGSNAPAGGGTGLAAWTAQVSKDIRENPEAAAKLAKFQKLDDIVKAYLAVDGREYVPLEGSGEEEWGKFWARMGKPESKEKYSFAREKDAADFLDIAYSANLTDAQAKAVYEGSRKIAQARSSLAAAKQSKELAATDALLKQVYGERYPAAVEMFKRGLGESGIQQALLDAGLAGRPEIVRAFIALGEAVSEGISPKGEGGIGSGKMKSAMEGGSLRY